MHDPGLIVLIALVLTSSVFLLTLLSTNAALVFLIFSMLLSPEIGFGAVQSDRAVVIRFDDLLLIIVFLTWLAKLAVNKQFGVLRSTPLNVPLGLFLVSCLVSTGWGILTGSVKNPAASFFYFLKYFEYFFLFFMVVNVVRERRQIELFLKAMFATAVGVSLFGYWQLMVYGTRMRVTAPFEGLHAEPNTLAGYLVLMIAVCTGIALYARSVMWRLIPLGLVMLMGPVLLYTYSRGGYAALIAMYLTFCLVSDRYKLFLLSLLGVGLLVVPIVIPATVFERLLDIFDPRGSVQFLGFSLSASPAQRVIVWGWIFDKWKEHPFLGFGVTGLAPALIDQQHALVIGELGIIGFIVYLWLRWRILVSSYHVFLTVNDPLAKGLSLGFLAGFVGLFIHSFAGNIFIIVRIMEPFWFLAALVMKLLHLSPSSPSEQRQVHGTV